MKNKILYTLFALILLVCSASCRKDMPEMQNPNTQNISNWDEMFDCYWKGMNYNYVFWDIDTTDWDEVYDTYKPLFEGIADEGFDDEETNQQALEWMTELSSTLIDHHLAVTFTVGGNRYTVYPGQQEVMSREGYRADYVSYYKEDVINYLYDNGRLDGKDIAFVSDEEGTRYYFSGLIDNQIAYFSFNQFAFISDLEEETNSEELQHVYDRYNDLLDNYEDLKGVIIDVRGNVGGYEDDLSFLYGKLISQPLQITYDKKKSGAGRLDFTPWAPSYLNPTGCNQNLDNIPVVVLTDMHSISMAEMATLMALQLPGGNGVTIGERTFGGTGTLGYQFEQVYAGTFSNDAIYVYMCSKSSVDASGKSHEGYGFDPTIELALDTDLITQGIDNQLERAVTYIKTGE